MTQNSDEYLNSEEASSILGVSRRTLERYAKEGKIQRYKKGTRVVFKKNDVIRLKKQLEEPLPDE